MVRKIARKIKLKWRSNAEHGKVHYETMVKEVEVNPMVEASKQWEKMKDKLIPILEAGIWRDIMAALPKELWDHLVIKLGIPHFVDGVRAKEFKVTAFADAWEGIYLPELEKLDKEIPPVTDADRERRMIENRKILLGLKGKWRPGIKYVIPAT